MNRTPTDVDASNGAHSQNGDTSGSSILSAPFTKGGTRGIGGGRRWGCIAAADKEFFPETLTHTVCEEIE